MSFDQKEEDLPECPDTPRHKPDTAGDGNTESSPARLIPNSRSRKWFLTFNNPSDTETQKLLEYCKNEKDYVIQEETGASGTPHLQGYIEFKNARQFNTLHKYFPKIHWETVRNESACIQYCQKDGDGGCTGRKWIKETKGRYVLKDPMDGLEPYQWQKDVIEEIKKEPDSRTIRVILDRNGAKGKTTLAKHLAIKYKALIVSGKANDVKHAVAKLVEEGKPPKIIIWNIPRSVNTEYISYQAIEEVKDGMFFSGKYESGMTLLNPPHVLIFTNKELEWEELTQDRWSMSELH